MPLNHSLRPAALAFACVLTVVSAAAQEPPKPPTVPTDALRLLDLWFDAQRDYERQPGISAGVVVGQQLVWKKGYGHLDAAGKVPAGADTIYSICSISKLFTSVAVMQLWEAGKLSLDDDVAKHVPDFAVQRSHADSGPITLRSLLTHSSGLPRALARSSTHSSISWCSDSACRDDLRPMSSSRICA